MLKATLSGAIIFLTLASAVFAAEKTTDDISNDHKTPVAQTTPDSMHKPVPVILQNEVIATGLCRLHLDNGTKPEVSCNKKQENLI